MSRNVAMAFNVLGGSVRSFLPVPHRNLSQDASFWTVAIIIAICLFFRTATDLFSSNRNWFFNEYGMTSFAGELGLIAAAAAVIATFSGGLRGRTVFAYLVACFTIYTILDFLLYLCSLLVFFKFGQPPDVALWMTWGAVLAWSLLAAFRTGFNLEQASKTRFGCFTALSLVIVLFSTPTVPLFTGYNQADSRVDLFYFARLLLSQNDKSAENQSRDEISRPSPNWEKVMSEQNDMIDKRVAELAKTEPDVPHAYFIGMAPYASQDVFRRELSASKQIFETHFNARNRTLILQNHIETTDVLPIASATNLNRAAEKIASKIDKERDVVVLFVTSHGSVDMASVDFYPLPLNDLTPAAIKTALDLTGAKNRVFILSACHSGSFVDDLKDDHTVIIAAAREDRTSFGCSNEREWTYFTNALFNHGFRQTRDLSKAFNIAKALVATWEKRIDAKPSEPQIYVGKEVGKVWARMIPHFDTSVSEPLPTPETAEGVRKADLLQ
jgi:hypothetical protein